MFPEVPFPPILTVWAFLRLADPGVQSIPQAVAHEIDAQYGQGDE